MHRSEPAAVTRSPDQALVVRRHQLAVVEREPAVRTVEEQRVVERPGPLWLDLGHAGHEPDPVLGGDAPEAVGGRTRNLDGLPGKEGERGLRAGIVPSGQRLRPDRGRISRNERLREGNEPGAGPGSLGSQLRQPVERRLAIQDHRLRLDAGDCHRAAHSSFLLKKGALCESLGAGAA